MAFWKTDQQLVVEAGNSNNEILSLFYNILDTDISNRWIGLVEKNNEQGNDLRYNYRKILSDDDILDRFKLFRDNIVYINSAYDRELADIISLEYLKANQNILNDLHEEFEIYGDRLNHLVEIGYFSNPTNFPKYYHPIWPGSQHHNDKVLHEAFLLLNEQIHNFEAIFRNWNRRDQTLCTCLWDFIPAGLHEDLRPEDYFLFSPNHMWGWAYLGYNTLGKHWASSCNDNDIEVVRRKQVRPQSRFAAETYMNFSLKEPEHGMQVNLYNWWLKNKFSDIIDPNEMKLKDLALGFIPIGKLAGYSINKEDYKTIDIKTDRQQWNKYVWSRFDRIIRVEIS